MPSFSHESFSSKADENGFRQRLSIDALKLIRRKTAHSDIYEGKAFSNGGLSDDKHQKKMLIKFLKNSQNNQESQDFASHTVNLRNSLENMAKEFNNSMKHMLAVKRDLPGSRKSNQIHFQELQMAQLESVSFWDKKRRKGEYFVFGEKLAGCKVFLDSQSEICEMKQEGKMRKRSKSENYGDENVFLKNRSRTFSLRDSDDDAVELTKPNDRSHDCLHAFVHFYFCHKNGEMVVDFLRGNFSDENGYTLITPTVHSLSRGFGPNDLGEDGIRRVIDSHRCNALCKHLPGMKDILNNAFCDGRTTEENTGYGNTNELVDDQQRCQQWAVNVINWPCTDFQLTQNGFMYPEPPRYEEPRGREVTVSMQCNAQSYRQSWQERATIERIEETQQEINRCFS